MYSPIAAIDDYFYKSSPIMSTTTAAPVNAKINTIHPIEGGAKGNIALFYYQGKYPIYKSLDDNMYHAKSVIDAWNKTNGATKKVDHWRALKETDEYICYISSETGIPVSELIHVKRQQNREFRHLDGTYLHEELLLDLAGWVSKRFRREIYSVFGDKAEIDRLNADINHKQSTIDELNAKMDDLLSINRSQKEQLNRMEHKMNKTNARLKVLDGVPKRLDSNISSGNTPENVYIYSDPDECDDDTLIIHLAARTDQTLKKIVSDNHKVYAHYKVGNAKDHVREIYNEAQSYGIIIESLKSHQIKINASKLPDLRHAITTVCRKMNAPSNILNTVLTKIETDNSIDNMKTDWEIDDSDIKRLCKQHRLTPERLCKIYNGNATYIRNGKRYDVALSSDNR